MAIVLSVLRFTDSDYLLGILWPLCCLSFDLRILITSLVSSNSSCFVLFFLVLYSLVIALCVLRITDSDDPSNIFIFFWGFFHLEVPIRFMINVYKI